jgi:hypothetical protein
MGGGNWTVSPRFVEFSIRLSPPFEFVEGDSMRYATKTCYFIRNGEEVVHYKYEVNVGGPCYQNLDFPRCLRNGLMAYPS